MIASGLDDSNKKMTSASRMVLRMNCVQNFEYILSGAWTRRCLRGDEGGLMENATWQDRVKDWLSLLQPDVPPRHPTS